MKYSVFNLYQWIFSISLGKENVESNFININGDLDWKKRKSSFNACVKWVKRILSCLKTLKIRLKIDNLGYHYATNCI